MGSGTERPTLQTPQLTGLGVGNVQGGNDLLTMIQERMGQGIPMDLQQRLINQQQGNIAGNTATARRDIMTAGANRPMLSTANPLLQLHGGAQNAMEGVYNNMAMNDYSARQNNFQSGVGNWLNLAQTGSQIGGLQNQLNLARTGMQNSNALQMYGIDKQNEFNWGQAVGGLFQGAGAVGGAMAGRPNKT